MKLSQEELFLLNQIYEDGIDKKSVIEELNSIDDESEFLKEFILKLKSLSKGNLKIVLEEGIELLNFSLEDI